MSWLWVQKQKRRRDGYTGPALVRELRPVPAAPVSMTEPPPRSHCSVLSCFVSLPSFNDMAGWARAYEQLRDASVPGERLA